MGGSMDISGDLLGTRSVRPIAARAKKEEPLVIESFDTVWDALGYSPQAAANLDARADLMIQIREIIRTGKWTQAMAAKRCGVSQPRINDLPQGKIKKFSIDALVNMVGALGMRASFTVAAL